jgi:hypothetical protein
MTGYLWKDNFNILLFMAADQNFRIGEKELFHIGVGFVLTQYALNSISL